MSLLNKKYNKEVVPKLKEELGIGNKLALPRIEKVKLNIGLSRSLSDSKFNQIAVETLQAISGQKPVFTKAKKSISSFKIRQGMNIGLVVTLRGKRMYDFLDKLVHVSLPRIRDFRGISFKSVDNQGNLNIGIKEHVVFPEIELSDIDKIHGLEICITTTAKDAETGLKLFKYLGFPIKHEDMKSRKARK